MQDFLFGQIAGSLSTIFFVTSNVPMLVKAFRTRNVRSYSFANIVLANAGNALYWFYLVSLPFGPVWLVQGFYTLSNFFMLVWYHRYRRSEEPKSSGGPAAGECIVL